MRFRFDLSKTLQVLAYLLKDGSLDKVKLMKLIYLADRAHFIASGVPITGDRLCAMEYGPVPSATLDAVSGNLHPQQIFRYLHVNDNKVELHAAPGDNLLSPTEKQTLDQILADHGGKDTWRLVRETHRLPEYIETYTEGTSRTIPFERIAKFSGNPRRFRHDRAVVSQESARQMACPFDSDENI
jgi:uncharacterized phage-associated protein